MRILCRHGFFSFYPSNSEELARFCSIFELNLVRMGDFFTFPFLAKIGDYTLSGASFMNLVANKTFEGKPWDLLKENKIVYHVMTESLVPISTVVDVVDIYLGNYSYHSEVALIQPGSLDSTGKRVASYDAMFDFDMKRLFIMGYWSE